MEGGFLYLRKRRGIRGRCRGFKGKRMLVKKDMPRGVGTT